MRLLKKNMVQAMSQQTQMWFHQQLERKAYFYQIPMLLKVSGRIDYFCLEKAINQIRSEQPSLRSIFYEKEGHLYQQVNPFLSASISVTDLRSFGGKADALAKTLSRHLTRTPINLEKEEPFRHHVYRVDEQSYYLIFIMHHIITDGWSWKCFFDDLFNYYKSYYHKNVLDVARKEYILLDKVEHNEEHLYFWKKNLEALPILRLPIQGQRDKYQKFTGSRYLHSLSNKIRDEVTEMSPLLNLTPSMIYFSAFQIALHYLSDQLDFGIGLPTANRYSEKHVGFIGCFINTLVYRASLDLDVTLEDFLQNVQSRSIDIFSHSHQQLSDFLNEIKFEHASGFNPLFQVMYIYQDIPFYCHWDSDCDFFVDLEELDVGSTVFELTFEIRLKTNGSVYVSITYRNDLYSEAFIQTLSKIFEKILLAISDPEFQSRSINDVYQYLDQDFASEKKSYQENTGKCFRDSENHILPQSDLHRELSQLWTDILKQPVLNISESFFHCGGTSLLAMRLLNQVHQRMEVIISFRDFFSEPTIQGLAKLIQEFYLLGKNHIPKIQSLSKSDFYLASYAQEQLWFISMLDPESVAYNVSGIIKFDGCVDHHLVETALNYILENQEALRVSFVKKNNVCHQYIAPFQKYHLEKVLLQDNNNFLTAKTIFEQLARIPFKLNEGPLYRFKWFEDENLHSYLFICVHHCVFDGWSLGIFIDEFKAYYDALSKGEKKPIFHSTVQYVDYAKWQRDNYSILFEDKIRFWVKELENLEPLELITDKSRPKFQSFRGSKIRRLISKSLTQSLNTFSASHGITLFQLLFSAYTILIYSINFVDDFVIGVPDGGRPTAELEKLIGFFVTILPVRIRIQPNISLLDFMFFIKEHMLEILENKNVPFELIVKQVKPERDTSRNPLIQVAFNLVDSFNHQIKLSSGLNATIETIDNGGAKYDLSLMIIDQQEVLCCELEYDQMLFLPQTIEYYLDCYMHLLQQYCNQPKIRIDELNWCKFITSDLYSEFDFKAHDLVTPFKKQVKLLPHKTAVISKKIKLSYKELDKLSDNLAAQLIQWVSGKKLSRVALMPDHDATALIALLAILKAHALYIPINSDYPKGWVNHMLGESQPDLLLFSKSLDVSCLPSLEGLSEIVDVNSDWKVFQYDSSDKNLNLLPDYHESIAYILFTSGSSGQPKPIYQNHVNVLKHVFNYIEQLEILSEDRVLQLASLSHDAAVMDIFSTLFSGATLYRATLKSDSLSAIQNIIYSEKISVLHATPSTFKALCHVSSETELYYQEVKQVILGGEIVDQLAVDLFKKYFSQDCFFNNLYGSSEYSFSFLKRTKNPTCSQGQTFPVGIPLADANIKLVDQNGFLHPLFGELIYQSEAVAVNQTQKSFHNKETSGFYTGDLFRVLSDGTYQFIARKDFQIKIRGQRVNLIHIETLLSLHPTIAESVILCSRSDSASDSFLGAFFVPKNRENVGEIEPLLRSYLKEQLPDYMLPSVYIPLEKIPCNKHGKIDRLTLLDLLDQKAHVPKTECLPSSEIEKVLSNIWSDLLHQEIKNVQVSFFDLGGHSLLLTMLQEEIRQVFFIEIPLISFFTYTSIRELAIHIDSYRVKSHHAHTEIDRKISPNNKKRYEAIRRRINQKELT